MVAIKTKTFQETFGRTPQTKILDHVWAHRDDGINIKELSRSIRASYVYTVNLVNDLSAKGLVVKEVAGRESLVRPNLKHGAIKSVVR